MVCVRSSIAAQAAGSPSILTRHNVPLHKPGSRRLLRLAHDVSAPRSVCASVISGNSGVGEKPLSADASRA
jgi:hypothetical protein